MRFKYYLRGCGLGIVLTAVILMISFHRNGGEQMSDAEIMHRASELGMVTPEESESESESEPESQQESESEPESESEQSPAKDEDTENAAKAEPTESAEADPGQEQEKAGAGDQEKEEPKKDVVEKITIVVRRGDVCKEIVRELARQGLVPDAEEFSLYMYENGYDNQIRAGAYTFIVGMDRDEIVKILTSKPE